MLVAAVSFPQMRTDIPECVSGNGKTMSNMTINEDKPHFINSQEQGFCVESDSIQAKSLSDITKNEAEPDLISTQNQNPPVSNERDVNEGGTDSENIHESKKLKESAITVGKLRSFFESLKQQHPESHLELVYINNAWKVWCGVCKTQLRPDKSGKALHNIQRQHFSAAKHVKNLSIMLQAEQEKGEEQESLQGVKDITSGMSLNVIKHTA